MKDLRREPRKKHCKSCPLYKDYCRERIKSWYVPTEAYPDEDGKLRTLFIGGSPEAGDDANGRPFYAKSGTGKLLRGLVKRFNGGSLEGVGFAHLVRCQPKHRSGRDREPDEAELAACRRYVDADIERYDPQVVVLLGGLTVSEFFPHMQDIGSVRGQWHRKDGRTFVMANHPAYAVAQGPKSDAHRNFKSDMRTALAIGKEAPEELPAKTGKKRKLKTDLFDEKPGESRLVGSVGEFKKLVKTILRLKRGSVVTVDTEDDNLNSTYSNRLLSVQLSYDGKVGHVLLLHHSKSPFGPKELPQVYRLLQRLFTETPKNPIIWAAQNAQFDLNQLRRELGIVVTNGPVIDTMQAAYLLNENRIKQGKADSDNEIYLDGMFNNIRGLSFGVLCLVHLGVQPDPQDEADKADRASINFWPMERFLPYAGKDAWMLWRLVRALLEEAEAQDYLTQELRLLMHFYAPANLVLSEMAHNGFKIDIEHNRALLNTHTSVLLRHQVDLMERIKDSAPYRRLQRQLNLSAAGGKHFLFGTSESDDRVALTKDDHLRRLFFQGPDAEDMDNEGNNLLADWVVAPAAASQFRKLKGCWLHYQPVGYSESGLPQVNKAFYEAHAKYNEETGDPRNLVALVADWVQIQTLMNNFVSKTYELIHPDRGHPDMSPDCRVRGNHSLVKTVSGRDAPSEPNMGQVPRADNSWKKATKDLFIVEEGNALIQGDLMANEVRWGFNLSEEVEGGKLFWRGRNTRERYRDHVAKLERSNPALFKLYVEYLTLEADKKTDPKSLRRIAKKGGKKLEKVLFLRLRASLEGDIHKMTAAEFYSVPVEEVTKVLRTSTKGIVFGYMYGRSVGSIAKQIKKTWAEAKELCNGFDEKFPNFASWLHRMDQSCEEVGYVESPIGRRRRFGKSVWSDHPDWRVARARRQARNSPIQGIASDSCFIAAGLLYQHILENGLLGRWKIINIVHDAIYLEVPVAELEEGLRVMEECLTTRTMKYMTEHWGLTWAAPLEADFEVGLSWGNMLKWDFSRADFLRVHTEIKRRHKERWGHSGTKMTAVFKADEPAVKLSEAA